MKLIRHLVLCALVLSLLTGLALAGEQEDPKPLV